MLTSGYCDAVIAGGVEFMSDVPIRHSRKMRQLMLSMNRAKSVQARLKLVSQMFSMKALTPEVSTQSNYISLSVAVRYMYVYTCAPTIHTVFSIF